MIWKEWSTEERSEKDEGIDENATVAASCRSIKYRNENNHQSCEVNCKAVSYRVNGPYIRFLFK